MLGGYDIFKEFKIRAFWASQPDSRLRPLLLRRLYPYQRATQSQSAGYLKAFFHVDSRDTESPFFSHFPRWRSAAKLNALLSEDVRAEFARENPLETIEQQLPNRYRSWDGFTRAQYLEARYLLPGYILSSQGDRVAMAHSIEARYPFLDYRVVEFASKLPSRFKMKVLREKYLLKRCAASLVPPAILNRHKQPYRAPDAASFFSGDAPDYVDELLSPERIRDSGLFHAPAVEKLLLKARRGGISSISDNMAVVALLSTQLLIERFLRGFPKDTYETGQYRHTAVHRG
jgi:asparagine synthase (glutamine-hydrolysing)